VDEDPFLEGLDVVDYRHSGARFVKVVGHVVDDWTPVDQVAGGLVGEFLAVERVALVGVVGD
jgi:hypothetical protein